MRVRTLIAVLLAIGLLGITLKAIAQEQEVVKPKKSILNRVDDFGKSVFGGILPPDKKKAKEKDTDAVSPNPEYRPTSTKPAMTRPPATNPPTTDPFGEVKSPRAGSILSSTKPNSRVFSIEKTTRDETDPTLEPSLPRVMRESDGTPKKVRRPLADESLLDDEDTPPAKPQPKAAVAAPQKNSKAPSGYFAEVPDLTAKNKAEASPLHERLSNFRQSVFELEEQRASRPQTQILQEKKSNAQLVQEPGDFEPEAVYPPERKSVAQRIKPATRVETGNPSEPALNSPSIEPPVRAENAFPAEPALTRSAAAPQSRSGSAFATDPALDRPAAAPLSRSGSAFATEPSLNRPLSAPVRSENAVPAEFPLNRPTSAQTIRSKSTVPTEPSLNRTAVKPRNGTEKYVYVESKAAPSTNPARPDIPPPAIEDKSVAPVPAKQDGVLIARKGPNISIETVGPRKITVGKESAYEVSILNSSETPAEELLVHVTLPTWAEVVGIETSSGVAAAAPSGQNSGSIQWKLGRLNVKVRERMTLRIVPRQNHPFDLAVRWEYKPNASQAMIEVQEPKLLLQLEGAREVLFGKKEVYRLRLANTGNGDAENVAISLLSIGTGENVPASHKVGILAAGEEKVLDVELTARQTGNLTIQVEANADGGAHAELSEKVLVRRAALKIDIEGPKLQFVGAASAFIIHVRNTGNAPARNLNLALSMPAGSKYLSGIENARSSETGDTLEWAVDTVAPDVEKRFVVKCSMGSAGISRLRLNAKADDELTASSEATVRVDAVANLIMDLKNPDGPVQVGEETVYEVRVRNRGSKEAEGVEVFAYFSRGIEPVSAEGAPNRLGPGQVTFSPVVSLAPGAEAVFKIRARAETAGNLVFRAEAHCKPLSARLISEATNLFYTDSPVEQQAELTPVSPQMK
jgi:hypothetical protein